MILRNRTLRHVHGGGGNLAKATPNKKHSLGLTVRKTENISEWYTQSLLKAEMIDYSDISGCYVLRPWSMSIWNQIRHFLQKEFQKRGIQEAYFPLLISEDALKREALHLEGFSPEVAWVTKAGDKALHSPLAIRPTSETAIYPSYAKWIRTRRDLPLRLNQWCNVLRWEFNNPMPFVRSREFLWQEGHSAFATQSQAEAEVHDIIHVYKRVYEELLAVPVTVGRKSQAERFAGADDTLSLEAFIPTAGRGLQAATSHMLGQNFSKMFNILFEDAPGEVKQHVWQTSWGFTTRSIGLTTLIHGDDLGLVLPPHVAPIQAIIIPVGITTSTPAQEKETLFQECHDLCDHLKEKSIRAECDMRDNQTPGYKFANWELRGVPLRIEVGPRDLAAKSITVAIRTSSDKRTLSMESAGDSIVSLLNEMHNDMLSKARKEYLDSIIPIEDINAFSKVVSDGKVSLAPWCGQPHCEQSIKAAHGGVKSLCTPLESPLPITDGKNCFNCNSRAISYTLFAKTY